ncbi:hypothetical protein [Niallia sp. Krafla_26]|uniref:hypothetical protein n=1 Tax=Niallia sp. Krafla_26 TaxID=3064703 RepID=UPI003D184E3F
MKFEANMPHLGQDLFNAYAKLETGEELTSIESALLEAVTKSREALTPVDVVVFAFPLWNLTIPTA